MTGRRTRCAHHRCRFTRASHDNDRCPRGGTYWKEPMSRAPAGEGFRVPMSFSADENTALREVLRQLQRGGDPRLVAKMYSQQLGNVLGKIERAQVRLQKRRESAAMVAQPVPPSDCHPPAVARDGAVVADASEGAC